MRTLAEREQLKDEKKMIEILQDSGHGALGFKASGEITKEDLEGVDPRIQREIGEAHGNPIGLLIDLTDAKGIGWAAYWEQLRFLHKYGGPIARVAILGAHTFEQLLADLARSTVIMQADVRYFYANESAHAWHWVKTSKFADEIPVRQVIPPGHLMSGYTPEYTGL